MTIAVDLGRKATKQKQNQHDVLTFLIVSIPDLCTLNNFQHKLSAPSSQRSGSEIETTVAIVDVVRSKFELYAIWTYLMT